MDNFRQHLLHHDISFIAFSMNELKKDLLWWSSFVIRKGTQQLNMFTMTPLVRASCVRELEKRMYRGHFDYDDELVENEEVSDED